MKRRKFTLKFKTTVVLATLKEHQSISELSMKYELAPTQISKWKKEFLAGAGTTSARGDDTFQSLLFWKANLNNTNDQPLTQNP